MVPTRYLGLLLIAGAAVDTAEPPAISRKPAFAIYLLEQPEQVHGRPPVRLERLRLSKTPLWTEADIIAYDWATHDIQLSAAARKRLPRPPLRGEPFVVVVDGVRIYLGAFYSISSSFALDAPVILVDPIPHVQPPKGRIRIDRAYPSDRFAKGKDVRRDCRIEACLKRLGKLRKPPPEGKRPAAKKKEPSRQLKDNKAIVEGLVD